MACARGVPCRRSASTGGVWRTSAPRRRAEGPARRRDRSSRAIQRLAGDAFAALEGLSEMTRATLRARHPLSIDPRRIVAHVLIVAALELRHPVQLVVLVISDDTLVHAS